MVYKNIQAEQGYVQNRSDVAAGLIGCALLGIMGWLGFADGNMDILGDKPKNIPAAEQSANAVELFRTNYQTAPDALKIAMLYGGASTVDVDKDKGGNGFLEITKDLNKQRFQVGQKCLAGTGYDTTPSEIRIRGRSYGGGDVSAVATVNYDADAKEILVYPASGQGQTLRFERQDSDGLLIPADSKTADTLRANGCDPSANPLNNLAG